MSSYGFPIRAPQAAASFRTDSAQEILRNMMPVYERQTDPSMARAIVATAQAAAATTGTPPTSGRRHFLRPIFGRRSSTGTTSSATAFSHGSSVSPRSVTDPGTSASLADSVPPVSFVDLPEGTYLQAALYLDAADLCQVDTACRLLRVLNQSRFGPWHVLGSRSFRGVELERDGIFDTADTPNTEAPPITETQGAAKPLNAVDHSTVSILRSSTTYPGNSIDANPGCTVVDASWVPNGTMPTPSRCNKHARVDWKGRYWRFQKELQTFRPPFIGHEIHRVQNPDEVAYCRCMLRADVLTKAACIGVYIEIEVMSNPDNLSLAVVDFEAGGHSSVTFSPDTGAVIRERKVREMPRKVEGAYIQPLAATLPGRRFTGSVGLYLYAGHLAFLRKCTSDATGQEPGLWESTGFVTDLSWAEGRCLTPCLAFRDEGAYHVKIVTVDSVPPLPLGHAPASYDEARWSGLDWEADAPGA